MEQWGWRWMDVKQHNPRLLRGMVYDPDKQEWDDTTLSIGKSVCDIFCPYFETQMIHNAIDRAFKNGNCQIRLAELERLSGAAFSSVRLVSAADKLHNVRSMLREYRECGEELWTKFNGGRNGTLQYYRALVDAFGKAGSSKLIDKQDRAISELERLAARRGDVKSDRAKVAHDRHAR